MSSPVDKSFWYQVYVKAGEGRAEPSGSMVLDAGTLDMGSNAVHTFGFLGNVSTATQWWQFWPVGDDNYLVRAAGAGPDVFLSSVDNPANPQPALTSPDDYPNDKSMLWKILASGTDGYYSMSDVANGTGWHLASASKANFGGYMKEAGSPDASGEALMSFSSIASANWFGYHSMNTPAVAGESSTGTSTPGAVATDTGPGFTGSPKSAPSIPTASQTSTAEISSSAMAPGTSAAIACVVTLIVSSLLWGGALFWLQRKWRRLREEDAVALQYSNTEVPEKISYRVSSNELVSPVQVEELSAERKPWVSELDISTPR